MTTVQNLVDSIEIHIRDVANVEVTEAQLLILLSDAAQDAGGAGWLIHLEDDESLAFITDTVEYAVPASFVYIKDLRFEGATADEYPDIIPRHYWQMRIEGGVAVIFLDPNYSFTAARKIKVVGFRRPPTFSAMGNTVEPGLEAFLRDRATCFALRFMSAGSSELDRLRREQAEIKFRDSEIMLERRPDFLRVVPAPRYVPGR